jgi:hypothetical protein
MDQYDHIRAELRQSRFNTVVGSQAAREYFNLIARLPKPERMIWQVVGSYDVRLLQVHTLLCDASSTVVRMVAEEAGASLGLWPELPPTEAYQRNQGAAQEVRDCFDITDPNIFSHWRETRNQEVLFARCDNAFDNLRRSLIVDCSLNRDRLTSAVPKSWYRGSDHRFPTPHDFLAGIIEATAVTGWLIAQVGVEPNILLFLENPKGELVTRVKARLAQAEIGHVAVEADGAARWREHGSLAWGEAALDTNLCSILGPSWA